jgi:hypothetical protein
MKFDFGISHWNELVFRYVPAQLVGADLKDALTISVDTPAREEFLYTPVTGSTLTGMNNTFQSFWYFGSLEFGVIGFVMCRLWRAACLGSMNAQLMYSLVLSQALESITHSTDNFIAPWVHMGLFLLPALAFARQRTWKGKPEVSAINSRMVGAGISSVGKTSNPASWAAPQ